MGFWSFMRDMFVFDWLFGHRKKESFWERSQSENQRFTDHYRQDDYNSGYNYNDYVQQDFDDDHDSGMFDDDF
ncbi:MAG: hypothetical protein NC097_02645 [Clostridium sp.]|nr:hypothetical protein [Prevotella sp.]MCM1428675.1 hypothetical protein [Clostridium sp.]MCM1475804.1 hypothetical protein [Muribaculaceae bacterium]